MPRVVCQKYPRPGAPGGAGTQKGMQKGLRTRWPRRCAWLAALLAAALAVAVASDRALQQRVPHCVAAQTRELVVEVKAAHWPAANESSRRVRRERVRLEIQVMDDELPHCTDLTGRRLRLNWHFPPDLRAGEIWRVAAEVRVPWGYQNPGGFDYERWLMANGLNGTGYIRHGRRLGELSQTLRRRLQREIEHSVQRLRTGGHLLALATGNAGLLTDDDWLLLRRTGTVHLLVISGLHVGLVAVIGFAMGSVIARSMPRLLPRVPAGWVAAGISLGAAAAFVWLSGAGVPAVRAATMSAFGVAAFVAGRAVPAWRWLGFAAIVVVCMEPLALLTNGFWLSFGAVCLLLGGFANRAPRHGWLHGLVRAQAIMVLGMTPLVALTGGEAAPGAGLANLYAVPWVSLVVVPLVLLSLVTSFLIPPLAPLCWSGADAALSSLLGYLHWLDWSGVHALPISLHQGLACLLALGCMMCAYHPRAILACLPLYAMGFAVLTERPPLGEVRVVALDVGQGSAVLVDTHRHRLLYDTGARFPSGFDLGAAVVLPAIAATGPRALDRMIVSHGDLDHAGGARAVLDGVEVDSLIANVAGLGGQACTRGDNWTWDGVHFAILHPPESSPLQGNNGSCVLQVTARGGRLIVAGDVELEAERLLAAHGLEPAELLFAPHHGSNTSSSRRFIEAVRPRFVIAMAGFGNRYGHPHPAVVGRYRQLGAQIWVTGRDGALTWRSHEPDRMRAARLERRMPWSWWINQAPDP